MKESGDRAEALRLNGPPVETIKLDAEIDATDQLEFPDQNRERGGVRYSAAAGRAGNDRLSGERPAASNNALAQAGMLEIVPMDAPLTLFVWSKNRIVPVRITDFSITEEAFDPALNPIRAKVSLGMRVLSVDDLGFDNKGGSRSWPTSSRRSSSRRRTAPARSACSASEGFHERSDASVAGDAASRRLATTAFPPNSRYHGVGTAKLTTAGRRDDRLSAPPLRAAAGAVRADPGAHRVAGRSARQFAAQYLGDPEQFWRICDANGAMRPDELTEPIGAAMRITLAAGHPGTENA